MSAVKEIQAVTPYGETDNVLELSIDVSSDAYVLEDVVKIVGDYSFSIWVKSAKSDCLTTFNVLGTSITESITTKWKKVSTTVKIDSLDNNNIDIIPDINTTIYLYEGFLSEGIIDNSWIPAPEDSEEIMESIKSEFNQTANRIEQKVAASDGRITTLSTTIDGVDTEIKNAKGDSASLKARIDGISVVANNADGKITKLETNVDGISGEINDAKGKSTTLKARLDGVDSIVKDSNNKYSSLKQTVDGFKQTVSEEYETKNDATKKETEIKQNIEGFKSTVSSKYATKEEINSLQIGDRFDSIETSIEQTNNQISLKASTETVTDIDNRANQLDKALSDALITINKNSDAIASLTARDFKVEFTTLTNQLTQLNGDLTSYKKEVGNWMRFDADGNLVLGATREEGQDAYELKLTKSRISFMLNDVEVAYISNNELYITNSTVVQNLKIGRFVWEVRGNGNLGLVWR